MQFSVLLCILVELILVNNPELVMCVHLWLALSKLLSFSSFVLFIQEDLGVSSDVALLKDMFPCIPYTRIKELLMSNSLDEAIDLLMKPSMQQEDPINIFSSDDDELPSLFRSAVEAKVCHM